MRLDRAADLASPSSSDALTPTMSAPAAAQRAIVAALPIPRRQPVTSAVLAGEVESPRRLVVHARQSTRIFIAGEPCEELGEHSGSRSSGSTAVISRSRASEPAREQLDRGVVVLRLVDARARGVELLQEEVEQR